jgi:hypothetical protein
MTLVAMVIALAISACGTSSPGPPATAPSNLLRPAEIDRYEEGRVERSFLEFWSSLQFQSWADVAAFYDPRFRDFIGTAKLVDAKKVGTSFYPYLKPAIVRVSAEDEGSSLYYMLRLEDGTRELSSTTWREVDGNWQLIYDSRLDGELNQAAQERARLAEGGAEASDPNAPASTEALRAGKAAAQIQARFLEDELNTSAP